MFNDFDTEISGFEPCAETEREVYDRSCQTADLKTSTQGTQTTAVQSSANQATPEVSLNFADSYDADKLLKFLNRIMPHIEEELKSCNNSNDLNFSECDSDFGSMNNDNQEASEGSDQKTTLKPDFCKEKIVSCLSWNSSNVMLAIAYSESVHEGWCSHETSVGIYNTGKPLFEKDPPVQILKAFGCVRFIKFHDRIPSLLAGGLYTGELVIWDLKYDNEVSMINKKGVEDEAPHVDVITFLTWKEDDNGLWLVTAGRDGRVIFWKVSLTNQTYEVNKRFLILKQPLASGAGSNEHLEILHMDFRLSSNYFVVGCGGGNIFYCSSATATSCTSSQYQNPFLRSYKPRKGIITCISCCNDLFASCGTDYEIHIFKYDQETPVLKIHTNYAILGVQWNSHRELISWGGSIVENHNIKDSSKKKLICEIEGSISTVTFRTQSNRCNRKFAVGDQAGEVLIFKDWTSTTSGNSA